MADAMSMTLMTEAVSLFATATVSSNDTADDKADSFCSGWRIVMSPLQNEVPRCGKLANVTINCIPTKLQSPSFSGGIENDL